MKVIIEPDHFNRTLKRMTHEIIERNEDLTRVILVGIERKGTPIAKEIASLIYQFEEINVPVESIDISSHRDDHKKTLENTTNFKTNVDDKIVILVDDVLYTGRSVRAAMDAIIDMGRPAKIELAILEWDKVVSLNPKFWHVFHNLGTLFYKQGKLEQAMAYWTKAIALMLFSF